MSCRGVFLLSNVAIVFECVKAVSNVTHCLFAGMNDSVNTPRESLEVARNAIIDLHALLKIMDGATSIQPSASDWGELSVA